jgi:hypothetical protein
VISTLSGVLHACRASLALTGALALACAVSWPTTASAGTVVAQQPADVAAYWTPERMEAAIPLGYWGAGTETARAARARGGSLHERVKRVKRFPKRTHGKVFFRLDGQNFVCSGTSVKAPNRSLVWTAGHCVYEPGLVVGGFATNWQFVPAYRRGHAPFGEWPAQTLEATQQWKNSSPVPGIGIDPTYDFGAATVAPSPGGRRLQGVVGGRGIAFNLSRDRRYHAFGYPAIRPPSEFTGERMFRCDSRLTGNDRTVGPPAALRIACDMTSGSSGGGWVTNGGRVASVTSYGYAGEPNSLYGPYMGNVARNLYRSEKR